MLKGPKFCHLETVFWDPDFKLLRNKAQRERLTLPPFPAQEIQTEKTALGRELGLITLRIVPLAFVRKPPSL